MNVGKQVNEMEYFLNVSEHLKVVLDRFSKQESADKNDLYDLVYSKRKLEELKNSELTNTDLSNDVDDLLSRIQLILTMLKPDDIENIIEVKIKDTSKLNKTKYGKKAVFENVTDSGNIGVISKIGGFKAYLKSRLPKIITLILVSLFMMVAPNIAKTVSSAMVSTVEQLVTVDESIDTKESINAAAEVEQIISDTENIKPQEMHIETPIYAVSILIRLILYLIFAIISMQLALDLLYIATNGQIGKLLTVGNSNDTESRIVSPEAQDALVPTYETCAHKVNSNDRIEVASALLNNMINYMTKQKNFVIEYAVHPTEQKRALKSLDEITDELQEIKGRTLMSKGVNRIEAYVDAEIMYEQLRKSMNKELDWLNNLEIVNEWS